MKKKNKKNENDKKTVSFLTALFFFCLAGLVVGIYLADREAPEVLVPPPSAAPQEKLPERVNVEVEKDSPGGGDTALKPEDLTFFNTLLDEQETESKPSASAPMEPAPKKAEVKRDLPISKGPVKVVKEKPVPMMEIPAKPESQEGSKETKSEIQKAAPGEPKKADGKRYRLQIASFAFPSEAEQMRHSLAAKGYADAMIRAVEVQDRGTRYRVYIGSYSTFEEAQRAESRVKAKDELSTLVVLDRE